MKNAEICAILREMGQFYEIADENRFKIRAYVQAVQTLEELTESVETLAEQERLTELPGIGKGIAEKIVEYLKTGKVKEHERLKRSYPPGLLEMMQVSGLGPKRIRILFNELKIDSIAKLKEAAEQGKLADVDGFGAKIQENILKGIAFQAESPQRMLLHEARSLAASIATYLAGSCRSLEKCVPAGSLRRWKETVGDLDFLCISDNPKEVIQAFVSQAGARQILAQGDTKASILHKRGIQCDLRVVGRESFGAALLYFTGSKEHNVELRERALKRGFTVNEYGLCALENKKKILAGRTEEEIYAKLGLAYIPPELRENRGEIRAAELKKLPKLIEEKDILGDFHNHTSLSDGHDTLDEMTQAAQAKGWEWFVSGDHSPSLKIAHGLTVKTLLAKKEAIKKLNQKNKKFTVLLGSEVDILDDGSMDYDAATLREIDFVVASIHSGFKQTEEKLTGRLLKAIENPGVDIVGHLTGRLIGTREGYPVDVQKILQAAKATDTALEINGQPQRMDLNDSTALAVAQMGIPLVLTTDAHSKSQLDHMIYAVAAARRAWIRKDQVLNCLPLEELRAWKRAE